MEQTKYSVGLDIGTTKIVAIIGRENEYGKIEVQGMGKSKSLGVHRGVVNNITQTIQSIQLAVAQTCHVFLLFAGDVCRNARRIEEPRWTHREKRWEVEDDTGKSRKSL